MAKMQFRSVSAGTVTCKPIKKIPSTASAAPRLSNSQTVPSPTTEDLKKAITNAPGRKK